MGEFDQYNLFLSRHATDRVREHHPNARIRGTLAMLNRAEEIESGTAAGLMGRKPGETPDRYFLAFDRRGIFVIARGNYMPWTLVTYVRLGDSQQEVALRLWPVVDR